MAYMWNVAPLLNTILSDGQEQGNVPGQTAEVINGLELSL